MNLSRLTVGPCSAANANNIATRYKETRSLSLKVDVHKILLLPMLGFCGVVVLIRRTTKVYAARCKVYIEVGPD